MKRLLLNLLCVLFAYPCFADEPIQLARMSPWVAGSVPSVACGDIDYWTTYDDMYSIGDTSGDVYRAGSFVADSTTTLKTLYLGFRKATGTAGNITVWLCSDNSGSPSSLGDCTQADNTVAGSSMPASCSADGTGYMKFQFSSGFGLTSALTYWIVYNAAYDASNFCRVCGDNDPSSSEGGIKTSSDGVSWNNTDATWSINYKASSCLE